jgi:ferric-dicitrate binding protein FerR (iron transport regulator)
MNQEGKSWQDDETLARYLAGEMSESESLRFEQELSVTGEHVIRIEQLKKQWASMKEYRPARKPDTRKAWMKLQSKIKADGDNVSRKNFPTTRFLMPVIQIAAAFLVLVAIGAVILFSTRNAHSDAMVSIDTGNSTGTLVKTMPDGSVVYIGEKSVCSFSTGYNRENRLMSLEGMAFFEVAPDRTRPFIVQTEQVTIEVTGTAFNVSAEKEGRFNLVVQHGQVKVTRNDNQRIIETVQAGEQLSLRGTGFIKSVSQAADPAAWFRECMHFKDEELETILGVLNRNFNTNFALADQATGKRKLTVTFRNESAETMTRLICLSMNLESHTINGTVVFSESGEAPPEK